VSLAVFTSDRFADHLTPPGHPERVERAEVMQVVASEFRKGGGAVLDPRVATEEELARVHDRAYLEAHTTGFDEFSSLVAQYDPTTAAAISGAARTMSPSMKKVPFQPSSSSTSRSCSARDCATCR